MLSNARFWVYQNVVGLLTWVSFRTGRIEPIRPPRDERIRFVPYGSRFPDIPLPGVVVPVTFPGAHRPRSRLRRIAMTKRLLGLLDRIAPKHAGPVPDDEQRFLAAVFPGFLRRAWPTLPRVPEGLRGSGPAAPDVVAELATRGPFASYLRVANGEEVAAAEAAERDYVIDLSWMLDHPAAEGLARPGGKAVLAVRDGRLSTVAIRAGGTSGDAARLTLLAGMNEDLTTFRHNLSVHLVMLTSFAVATTNALPPAHPVRRLLHHCFHTVLIGNREVAELQFSGRRGFSARIFSHDHQGLAAMGRDYLGRYDFWDFEPEVQFARRGTAETPFTYPYRDNVLRLWEVTSSYVSAYLGVYYADDAAARADVALTEWVGLLDDLLPNGVRPQDDGTTLDWLGRLCATLIHVSTVEHDYLNNIAWNYSTLGWIVPTVVPLSGTRMDRRRAFDLVATIIGTWKPYNMLLTSDIASLALDDDARRVMEKWISDLGRIQEEMSAEPIDPG
ncbi:MAG: hypothetical protein ABIW46_03635, partial [Acidimicrobiales bacterium]